MAAGLIKALRIPELLPSVPSAFVALLIAESFYKFHSFTLECVAFLATWYVADFFMRPLTLAFVDRARAVALR